MITILIGILTLRVVIHWREVAGLKHISRLIFWRVKLTAPIVFLHLLLLLRDLHDVLLDLFHSWQLCVEISGRLEGENLRFYLLVYLLLDHFFLHLIWAAILLALSSTFENATGGLESFLSGYGYSRAWCRNFKILWAGSRSNFGVWAGTLTPTVGSWALWLLYLDEHIEFRISALLML